MKRNLLKPLIIFIVCIIFTFVCAALSSFLQRGFGSIEIETGYFSPENNNRTGYNESAGALPVRIAYRLYKPKNASAANPVPAVLAMHGYQNDKDTSAAFCIELARRGIAVLSIDLYGHGDTKPGMGGRGYGQYSIKNLEKPLKGPERYMTLLTFSIQDFFYPEISSGVKDSSMGGKNAWLFLSSLPFVDSSRMGITGHSLGTWAAWPVAAEFPEHKTIVLQCSEIYPDKYYDSQNIKFNNVLLLQSLIEEFENMRDYQLRVRDLVKNPVRYHDFMGQSAPVEWNRTYGSFNNGSARRMELIETSHRLVTYNNHALTTAMNWFTTALEAETNLASSDHIHWIRELLNLAAMLAAMVSMMPLFLILTQFNFFKSLSIELRQNPKQLLPSNRTKTVIIAILISGLTFPFLSQLGHALLPLPESIFRMTIGSGFITWLGFLMIVSLLTLIHWYKKGGGKKTGWKLNDLGMEDRPEKDMKNVKPEFGKKIIITRSIIMAFILTGFMYILVCISVTLFNTDFRFIWPIFKPFNLIRFGQFWVYLPVYAAFFTINAGVKLYGQLRLPESKLKGKNSPALTQLSWWGYSILVMLGGPILIALIEYIPFFLGYGPGADIFFSSLFGGPFMSVLILLIPQFAIFFFFSTWLYRKSGTVYTGSFVLAILATWVLTGGSAIF